MEHLLDVIENSFKDADRNPFTIFFAPGRVNLIGEHTDYNGGMVFPTSISNGTFAAVRKRNDRTVTFYSTNMEEDWITGTLDDLDYKKEDVWANFPKGMINTLQMNGFSPDKGMDIIYEGTIPHGSGLSSSASLGLVTGFLCKHLFSFDCSDIDLAHFAMQMENDYIGVQSGIMDQFAIAVTKENHGLLLNCETLHFEHTPLYFENYKLIIMDTKKERTLAGSAYNKRRQECEDAVIQLNQEINIKTLSDLSSQLLEEHKHLLTSPSIYRRARHVVSENERTRLAFKAMMDKDIHTFGELMNQSHDSLKHDYEVTGPELDTLVDAALELPYVTGARMTGAGFGGCAIALVDQNKTEEFKEFVRNRYEATFNIAPEFYETSVGASMKEIRKEEAR